jgi:hypothetical protein
LERLRGLKMKSMFPNEARLAERRAQSAMLTDSPVSATAISERCPAGLTREVDLKGSPSERAFLFR